MNINLFNKTYKLRHFYKQQEINGYVSSPYKDEYVSMHLYPMGANQSQALPEGIRNVKRIAGESSFEIFPGDEISGRQGDMVEWEGNWYVCTSCIHHIQTILNHYSSQFTLVPKDGSGEIETDFFENNEESEFWSY